MKTTSKAVAVLAALAVVGVVTMMSVSVGLSGEDNGGGLVATFTDRGIHTDCVEERPGIAIFGLWQGHPPHARYHERKGVQHRSFRLAPRCVREGLRGKNLVFLGDESVRSMYMALVSLVHDGEYSHLDTLSPRRSVYSDGHKEDWSSSQEFLYHTAAHFGGAECCECSREHTKSGAPNKDNRPVENRWYHNADYGFNITYIQMAESARGGDMAGWSPSCPLPLQQLTPQHRGVDIKWPDQNVVNPKAKPSSSFVAKLLTKAWGAKAVDGLVWGYTNNVNNRPYEHASLDNLQGTVETMEGVMRPDTGIKVWASSVTHPGSNGFKKTLVTGRAEWVDKSEVAIVDWLIPRKWTLLPRSTMMSEIADELMPLDMTPNDRQANRELIYQRTRDMPQPYFHAAFSDVLLNTLLPAAGDTCTRCTPPTPSPSPLSREARQTLRKPKP